MSHAGPFLFGKLPGLGDFVARGLDAAARAAWDERCAAALADARARLGEDFDAAYEATPPRGFRLPAIGTTPPQIGCVAPSRDRIGRAFPLVIGLAEPAMSNGGDGGIVAHLESCLYDAILGRRDIDGTIDRAARPDASFARGGDPIPAWETGWIGAGWTPGRRTA